MNSPFYPTSVQTLVCVIQCQKITSLLKPIYMVRLDERTKDIYILAGEDLGIVVPRDGKWRFE